MKKTAFSRWRAISLALCLLLLLAFVLRAEYVLVPARTSYGATWNMYLREPRDSIDVLFFGSSMAYCDVIPAELYAETGLTAYVMAGPEQTVSLTYYAIREALKTQSPSLICLEMTGLMFERYQGYTRVNVSYMPRFSENRWGATLHAEPEERFGLLFPLYNYHDRWQEENPLAFFRPRADAVRDPYAGATLMTETRPQSGRTEREYTTAEDVYQENMAWLHRIEDLCTRQGVDLVLFQVPSCAYLPERWMERIRSEVSPETEIVDFNAGFAAMGMDPETDFYDFLHCNFQGAFKFNLALAEYLRSRPAAAPAAHDEALWQERIDAMEALWTA